MHCTVYILYNPQWFQDISSSDGFYVTFFVRGLSTMSLLFCPFLSRTFFVCVLFPLYKNNGKPNELSRDHPS